MLAHAQPQAAAKSSPSPRVTKWISSKTCGSSSEKPVADLVQATARQHGEDDKTAVNVVDKEVPKTFESETTKSKDTFTRIGILFNSLCSHVCMTLMQDQSAQNVLPDDGSHGKEQGPEAWLIRKVLLMHSHVGAIVNLSLKLFGGRQISQTWAMNILLRSPSS